MADNLQDILGRLRNKTMFLVERYNALEAEKNKVDEFNTELQNQIVILKKQLEESNLRIEYLTIAKSIIQTPEDLAKSKQILSKLVQEVDKCISQLNE